MDGAEDGAHLGVGDGGFAGEEEGVLDGVGEEFGEIKAEDGEVTVCAANVGICGPIVCMDFDEAVIQSRRAFAENLSENFDGQGPEFLVGTIYEGVGLRACYAPWVKRVRNISIA